MLKQATLQKIIKILSQPDDIGSKLQDAQSMGFKSVSRLQMKGVKVP